jgi:5-methylcytosine-specific restriction endonuclease McrA
MYKSRVDGKLGYKDNCDTCNTITFKPTSHYNRAKREGKKIYCSKGCANKGVSKTLKHPAHVNTCESCSKKFINNLRDTKKTRFCSLECFGKKLENKVKCTCTTCGIPVVRVPSMVPKNVYCSKKCADLGYRGENNPRWIKDRTLLKDQSERKTAEYADWRDAVYKRDEYTCQHCFTVGCVLNAHHIKSFKDHEELRIVLSNGITLCKECHVKEHMKINRIKKSTIGLTQGLHRSRHG